MLPKRLHNPHPPGAGAGPVFANPTRGGPSGGRWARRGLDVSSLYEADNEAELIEARNRQAGGLGLRGERLAQQGTEGDAPEAHGVLAEELPAVEAEVVFDGVEGMHGVIIC